MTLQTEILSTETSDFPKEICFLKTFNSLLLYFIIFQAENTYILTLDGDVDFNPDAVRLLVDRLKTNKKVGAACGRIHPTGSGIIPHIFM